MVVSTLALVFVGVSMIHTLDRGPRRPSPSDRPAAVGATDAEAPVMGGSPGSLRTEPRLLEQPAGHVGLDACDRFAFQWIFPGMTAEQAVGELREGGLTVNALAEVGEATCDASGCVVVPTVSVVEQIPATVRQRLYAVLGRHPENPTLGQPYRRPLSFGTWSNAPGLSMRARQLLHNLTWRQGDHEWFADEPLVCRALTDPGDRLRMLEVLRTRYGLSATLSVKPGADVGPLRRWWSRGSSVEAVDARLEEARRSPTGALPVRDLLPPFPRTRLDTFPRSDEPAYDCFWTALHFFDANPSAELPGTEGFAARLTADYVEVPMESIAFGDVLVFHDASGTPMHAMNFVGDNVVFTKNGGSHRRPWLFQTIDEVRLDYAHAASLRAYRRRPS